MNSIGKYVQDYNEAVAENPKELNDFLAIEQEKAFKSYPEGKQKRFCDICGELLVYNSISYYEGYHIDSCV